MYQEVAKDAKGFVAYAHAWIYSAKGKPVFLNTMLSGTARIWVNGKALGGFAVTGLQCGFHLELPIEKGWNRLLLRVAPLDDTGWSKGVVQWHCNAALFGTEKSDYESKNILWSTPMFDHGPGVGSPILVGEKLFVQAEAGALLCISAKDGKVLWAKHNSYADAATPGERQENSKVFAEIDKLSVKINDALNAYCDDPDKHVPDHNAREELSKQAKKINALLKKMNSKKYPGQSGCEAGDAAPTPVSDGHFVYALYGPGVVACFDLAGNRKWTTVLDIKHPEHGYCASPCLVDGKVVVKVPSLLGAVALDCKTGAVVMPISLWKSELYSYTTPLPLVVGGEKLLVQSCGVNGTPMTSCSCIAILLYSSGRCYSSTQSASISMTLGSTLSYTRRLRPLNWT
jgi:outer membrane protein assembly factor BamB